MNSVVAGIFILLSSSICAFAAVVDGFEIRGMMKSGSQTPGFILPFSDNILTSGTVINSFGDFLIPAGTTITPTPLIIPSGGGPVKNRNMAIPAINSRSPYGSLLPAESSNVQGSYGEWHPWRRSIKFHDGLSVAYLHTTLRTVDISFEVGQYNVRFHSLFGFYDDTISHSIIVGLGHIQALQPFGRPGATLETRPVSFILSSRFDVDTSDYSLAVTNVSNVPAPMAAVGSLSALGLLWASSLRRRRAGRHGSSRSSL